LVDAALVAGLVALVLFPILARLAADRLPTDAPPLLEALPADARAGALRDLPAARQPGGDVRAAAIALLGERRAARLLELVRTGDGIRNPVPGVYPYRYPPLERLLPERLDPVQANELGARLIALAAARRGQGADAAAFALLDRARRGGGCEPAMNVLLLVASDSPFPDPRLVAREGARASRACPGDPTPLWLLGQWQSTSALPDMQQDGAQALGLATFRRLVRELPGSAAAWAGQADALLRVAATTPPEQPWVARHLYERALAGYRRAARLSPGIEPDMGIAKALAGLGRIDEAVALQQRAVAGLPSQPLPQAQLVVYLEQARRFDEAVSANARLIELEGNAPPGPGLFPAVPAAMGHDREHDAYGLISLGAGRLAPLSVSLDPPFAAPAPAVGIGDLSFLPVFRPSIGMTGSERWCADWARRRDLLVSGRPAEALARMPVEFEPLEGGYASGCAGFGPLLGDIARLELGQEPTIAAVASERIIGDRAARTMIEDERQNLWRWAGDFARAERAAREWVGSASRGSLPLLRLGEIEFLRGRFDDAARDFAAAARRARERAKPDPDAEARAMLDRGAALVAAGRREEGEEALRTADDIASRAAGPIRLVDDETYLPLVATSYYARVQLGEAAREAGALPAAADAYAAARERIGQAGGPFHVEQLDNNAAIVDAKLGRVAAAVAASRRAVAVDPENPALLMTAGFAAERAGDHEAAVRYNRAALAADATAYPAANDLAVLLARQGRDDAAVAALRRAVGAEPRYALGWFNLGVILADMGPAHLLSSQGALARAFTLDPDLRDRKREPTLDAKTYRSGLDVSRPLPPEWSFAASQKQAPAKTVGLVALLVGAFALSRALAARGSGRALAETWLAPLDRATGRLTFLRFLGHPAVAIVATLVVFLAPLARDPGGGVTAAVAGALGLCVLIGVALRGRSLTARGEPGQEGQRTWPPGLVFGLGGAAAGVSWAPLPVLSAKASPRLHWAAPVALAAVALPLVVATVWSDIPLTRSLAAAALIMAASVLTPVKPVDGGAIAAAGGTAAGLTGIALAVLLAVGLD
jgi:tetratricopeptide (TPR) repeat protein